MPPDPVRRSYRIDMAGLQIMAARMTTIAWVYPLISGGTITNYND